MKKRSKVGIRRLKNEASKILEEVRETGESYVVTRRGRPVAVLRPWTEADEGAERRSDRAAALERLEVLARRVGAAAGRRSAAAAVSAQRR